MRKMIIAILFLSISISYALEKRFIIVDQNGTGDFKSITAAIQSLPMFNYQRTVIFIKNGSYNEKIKIDQDYVTLKGEDREKTILHYSQLRTDWQANKDSIGPGVINLYGDDFILENMTVENTQPKVGPHAFTIYGFGTRTILINCNLLSKGGDTVSLWDYKTGMYYHANCTFVGAVDFVCPRGWCFIRDSKFYEVSQTAAIWHAGGDDITQKFVIRNSTFDGVKGFELGRHHYESQFYLIDCTFSDSMSDKSIYRVAYQDQSKNRPFNWGERYYYYNCKGITKNYEWHKDNLSKAKEVKRVESITPFWTFDGKWDPEGKAGPKILNYVINDNSVLLFFNEKISIIGDPVLKSASGRILKYSSGAGSSTIQLISESKISRKDLDELKIVNDSKFFGCVASISERPVDFNLVNK